MKFSKFGFILLTILFSFTSYSQENYLPGYAISVEGDTLRGQIDFRDWEKSPNKIFFRENLEEEPVLLTPLNTVEVRVNNQIYIGQIVDTEISPIKTNALGFSSALRLEKDTTFLQTLIDGPKSLFEVKKRGGRSLFYIRNNGEYQLLIFKKFKKEQNGGSVVVKNQKYLGQLSLYLEDCPSVLSNLDRTSYDTKSISKLFDEYYACGNQEASFERKQDKVETRAGVFVGVSMSDLNISAIGMYNIAQVDFGVSVAPSFGLSLDLVLPRNNGKWSIYNEILYTEYSLSGESEGFYTTNVLETSKFEFSYSYLKLNTIIRYRVPFEKTVLFINGGFSNGLIIKGGNHVQNRFETGVFFEPRKHEQGLILGAGLQFGKLSFEVRRESTNGMSPLTNLSTKVTRSFFLVNYKI